MIEIKQGVSVLHKINEYTFNASEMGDANISLVLRLPVATDPAFSKQMFVERDGEKFYLTTTEPQAAKDTSSLMYNYSLLFDSERSDLKRRNVRDLAWNGLDAYVSKGLVFGFNANLSQFCHFLQLNLNDCFGTRWIIDVNPALVQINSVRIDVDNAYIFDLLLKTYEYFGVRWKISPVADQMMIKIGYPAEEIPHVFEYGSEKGLTKITRENPSAKIVNRLRGVGSTRNVPTNYFTDRYSGFPADPNPIAGTLSFKNIMPKCFRDSLIAGLPLVDYVQDDALILKNGLTEDGLVPNEEIYPSIEGVEVAGLGRIDEIVYAEKIEFDDPEYKGTSPIMSIKSTASVAPVWGSRGTQEYAQTTVNETAVFHISENCITAKLNLGYIDEYENVVSPKAPTNSYSFKTKDGESVTIHGDTTLSALAELVNTDTNTVSASLLMTKDDLDTTKDFVCSGLIAGNYKFRLTTTADGAILNANSFVIKWSVNAILYNVLNVAGIYKPTFDIWVKDIGFDLRETDAKTGLPKYAGSEDGKIAFKSGSLAGYEFTILQLNKQFAVALDTTKSLNGVQSKYRITLIKSDEEYKASGMMIPNSSVHAFPTVDSDSPTYGDKIAILDVQMPQSYIYNAEQRVQDYLVDQLDLIKVESPAYTIEFLPSFFAKNPNIEGLIKQGNVLTVSDPRLVNGSVSLYINNVSLTDKDVLRKYTVTVTNKVTVNGSSVQRIQSQIDALYTGQYSNAQSTASSILALQNKFLQKNAEDTAYQPITFKKETTISSIKTDDFRQGQFGGAGGSMYKDVDGSTVMEVDRLRVRKEAIFNEVVINQIKFQGGIVVYSAANMEVSAVEKIGDDYRLFFDTKGNTVHNQFALDDIIRCQRFTSTTGQSKYYSTKVIDFGGDFIDISELYKNPACILNPEIGDQIVQFGNTTDKNRQSVIEVDVLQMGRQTFYQHINSYDLTDKNYIDLGMIQQSDSSWRNMIRVYGDAYIGARDLTSYIKFNETTKLVEFKGSVSFKSASGYTEVGAGISAAQTAAEAYATAKVNNLQIGGVNLLKNSNVIGYKLDGESKYELISYSTSKPITVGNKYTLIANVCNWGGGYIGILCGGAVVNWNWVTALDNTISFTFTLAETQYPNSISFIHHEFDKWSPYATGNSFVRWACLYEGDVRASLVYVKSPEDVDANIATAVGNVTVGGRNLVSNLPANWEIGLWNPTSGLAQSSTVYVRTKGSYALKENTDYMLSSMYRVCTVFYNSSNAWISYIDKAYGVASLKITTPAGTAFCRHYTNTETVVNTTVADLIPLVKIKLEKGNKVTDFTPSNEDVASDILAAKNAADAAWAKGAEADYLKSAMNTTTDVDGGLITPTLLRVKDNTGKINGGLSGIANDNVGFWTGGEYQDAIASANTPTRVAVIDRKDGSGHRAKGALKWTKEGVLSILGGFIGSFSIFGSSLISGSIEFAESAVETMSSLLTPIQETITAPAEGWYTESSTSLGFSAQTQALVVSMPSVLKFNFHAFLQSTDREKQWTLEVSNDSNKVIYTEQGSYSHSGVVSLNVVPATYVITLRVNVLGQQGTIGDNSAEITGYETPTIIAANAFVAKTKIGNNGLFSFWSNLCYFYFSALTGLKVRGATDIPAGLGGASISAAGGLAAFWGKITGAGTGVGLVYKNGDNYTIYHYIGDTNYSLILTPMSSNVPYFSSKTANSVVVTCAGGFDFVLIRTQ